MGRAIRVLRRSLTAFSQNYHSFTSTAFLLATPVSAAILISQSLFPYSSPFMRSLSSRMHLLFEAAGFPAYSGFFSLLNLKLCQSICSFFFTLPVAFTFLLLAKTTVLRCIHRQNRNQNQQLFRPLSNNLRLFCSLLLTHIFNSFVTLSANAAVFSLLFLAFNVVDLLGITSSHCILVLSAAGAIIYSLVLANATVISNLATVVSALEDCSGYIAVLKACFLVRGAEATAMTLALPTNLGLAAIEALFQYRVVKPYRLSSKLSVSVVWEGFSLTYMHSLLIVLDIIINYMFYKSCKPGHDHSRELQQENKGSLEA